MTIGVGEKLPLIFGFLNCVIWFGVAPDGLFYTYGVSYVLISVYFLSGAWVPPTMVMYRLFVTFGLYVGILSHCVFAGLLFWGVVESTSELNVFADPLVLTLVWFGALALLNVIVAFYLKGIGRINLYIVERLILLVPAIACVLALFVFADIDDYFSSQADFPSYFYMIFLISWAFACLSLAAIPNSLRKPTDFC